MEIKTVVRQRLWDKYNGDKYNRDKYNGDKYNGDKYNGIGLQHNNILQLKIKCMMQTVHNTRCFVLVMGQ